MGLTLKQGKDGLVHVALVIDNNYYETACSCELLSTLGTCEAATCVVCASGIITCGCGASSTLHFCGYDQEIDGRDVPCKCCDYCVADCIASV